MTMTQRENSRRGYYRARGPSPARRRSAVIILFFMALEPTELGDSHVDLPEIRTRPEITVLFNVLAAFFCLVSWAYPAKQARPETQDSKLETQNSKPQTPNPKPQTQNPKTETLNPQTSNPQSSTLNLKPYTLNLQA